MDGYPPFPENLPIADLPRLSYAKLLSRDPVESSALFEASNNLGFFLIDLRDAKEGPALLEEVATSFQIGKSFFALEEEEQKLFKRQSSNIGYKPMGAMVLADGSRDLTEICAVGRDPILDPNISPIPKAFSEQRGLLTSLIEKLHPLAMLILSILAHHPDVPFEKLEALHNRSSPSGTQLRFLHNPPQSARLGEAPARQASLLGHTDSGSITILFPTVGGLQILPPDAEEIEENWRWVKSELGCAVINMGDPLVQWSGGLIRSAYHRVLYAPGAQSAYGRYSFGYFLKPADEAAMQRFTDGKVIPRLSEEDKEEQDTPSYVQWHREKTEHIMKGVNQVKSRGGLRKKPLASAIAQPVAT